MTRFFNILVLLVGLIVAQPAAADDLLMACAVLEDPSGTLTIADVAGRDFTPIKSALAKGYTSSAFWLRVQVRAPAKGSEVVLRLQPTFLDEIRLFEPDAGAPRDWKTRVTGDRYAYAARDRPSIIPSFVVNVTAPQATYYLRLTTTSTLRLDLDALEPHEADHKDHQLDLLQEFFVLLMVWLLLWAIHDYRHHRQAVVGLFCVHQIVYILDTIAVTGYLAPWMPSSFPELADHITSILICTATFTCLLFSRALFKLYAPPPLLMRCLDLLLLGFPIELASMALGHAGLALHINAVVLLVQLPCLMLLVIALRPGQVPHYRVLQVICGLLGLLMALLQISILGGLNFIDSDLRTMLILIVYGVANSTLVAMMLYARSRQLRRQARQSAIELVLAQKDLDLERQLKAQAEIQARTDYLTGLHNRRHFAQLAERELARSISQQIPLSLLMIDIDHFKSINDTWGHAAGDEVLQRVAQIIKNMLCDLDIVARLGGEEFSVVLLETAAEQARQIAQRICTTIENTLMAWQAGVPVQVTVSIGLTALNHRQIDLDNLLREADQALYEAKQSGRNRVHHAHMAETGIAGAAVRTAQVR
jgi:diguanylate cyclase (GGDEF)-like protein